MNYCTNLHFKSSKYIAQFGTFLIFRDDPHEKTRWKNLVIFFFTYKLENNITYYILQFGKNRFCSILKKKKSGSKCGNWQISYIYIPVVVVHVFGGGH